MVSILEAPHSGLIPPKTMLIGFAADLVLGAASITYHAAFLLSMVFGYGGLFPLGFCGWLEWKPCLANVK